MKKMLLAGAVLAILSACSPSTDFTDAEKALISSAVGQRLKDPFSAQYEWPQRPKRGTDVMCSRVNAKNSFGAYSGWREYTITLQWKDDKIITADVLELQAPDGGALATAKLCQTK